MIKKAGRLSIFLMMFLLAIPTCGWADDNNASLSLENAWQMAVKSNPTLKNDQTELDKRTYLKDRAAAYVRYTPVDYTFNPSDSNVLSSFMQAQFAEEQQKRKIEADKQQLYIDVHDAYYQVLLTEQKVLAAKKNDEIAQVKNLQNIAKKQQGVLIDADLFTSQASVDTAKAAVKQAQNNVDNSYVALDKLININISDRPVLVDSISYQPTDIDIDSKANIAAECSYETWSADEAAKIADQTKIFAKYYDVGDYNVEQANVTASDTKNIIRQNARSLGLGLQYLEKKYAEVVSQRKQADEMDRVAKSLYSVGMSTKDTVLNADMSLLQLKAGEMELAAQYNKTRDMLLKMTNELQVQ